MGNPNKDKNNEQGDTEGASADSITSPRDAHHTNRDLCWEKQVVEAVTREMARAHAHYQALLNERKAAVIPTSLKVTSGANGFKVMDPFDWTKDKAIYQRWQMWSEKARHTLDTIEGDSEKSKISYFHHWIDGKGMGKIESWKNKKILISQEEYDRLDEDQKEDTYSSEKIESYFTLFESLLAPRSNPLLAVEELCFAKQGSMDSGEFHAHVVKIAKDVNSPTQQLKKELSGTQFS